MNPEFIAKPPLPVKRGSITKYLMRMFRSIGYIIWQIVVPFNSRPEEIDPFPEPDPTIKVTGSHVEQCQWIFDQADARRGCLEQKAQSTFGLMVFLVPLLTSLFVFIISRGTTSSTFIVTLILVGVSAVLLLLGFISAVRAVAVKESQTLFLNSVLNEDGQFRQYDDAFRARGLLYCASLNTAMNDHIAQFVKGAHIMTAAAVLVLIAAAVPTSIALLRLPSSPVLATTGFSGTTIQADNRGGGTDARPFFVRVDHVGSSENQLVALSPIFWIWAAIALVLLFTCVLSRNKWVKGATLAASIGALSLFPIESVRLLDHIVDFNPNINWGARGPSIASALTTDLEPCAILGFPGAEHRVQPNLVGLTQRPAGCFGTLTERLKQSPVGFVLIIGRADRRALLPKAHRAYGSNLNLAYTRALSIKKALLDACTGSTGKTAPSGTRPGLAARIIILSAGASDIEAVAGDADDRSVEIIPYWTILQSSVGTPK